MASAPAIVPTCPGMGCPISGSRQGGGRRMPAPVPEVLAAWMRPFRGYFTNAVWRHALVLVAGALLAPGRRTVTAALRVMGLEQAPGFAVHHRVLSHARWSSRAVGHRLLRLLVAAFVPMGPVIVGIDDTIERRWGPRRRLIVVADSSFAAIGLLRDLRQHLCVISRLRLDAGLYAPPPPRRPGTRGRPRIKGARLPSLAERLTDPATRWHRTTVDHWYGRSARRLDIASGTALWPPPGMRVPIRWVLVRDPKGEKEPQAFLSTALEADPSNILRWFVRRWRTETTFEEARRHLGVETQRQWSDLAILRITPALLGLFSLVTLWATRLATERRILPDCVCWSPKHFATFSDALALVRSELWTSTVFGPSPSGREMQKIPADLLNRLMLVACRPP